MIMKIDTCNTYLDTCSKIRHRNVACISCLQYQHQHSIITKPFTSYKPSQRTKPLLKLICFGLALFFLGGRMQVRN